MPNIRSDRPSETRDFFVDLLGLEVAMDLGWVVTVASPTNPSIQVTIVGNSRPEVNGTWTITFQDATHFFLDGSSMTGVAGTGGSWTALSPINGERFVRVINATPSWCRT